jgi:hypothetical protein
VLAEHLLMGERAALGEVCAALGDGSFIVVGPRLVVLRRIGEGVKQRVVALCLDEAKRRCDLGLVELVDEAVQLLAVRHALIVLPSPPRVASEKPCPDPCPQLGKSDPTESDPTGRTRAKLT